MESGLITLIGATTENPYFEVNSALLSRCQLFELKPLSRRGADPDRPPRRGCAGVTLTDEVRDAIVASGGGDARNTLNILEAAAAASGGEVTVEHIRDAARKRPLLYDKGGDHHYDVTSAFIKSMRGSDADAAIYYLAVMIAGGEDPKFIARRMIVFASEDVGNADPRALEVAVAAARAVEFVGLPEARINLSQAARLPVPGAQVQRLLPGDLQGARRRQGDGRPAAAQADPRRQLQGCPRSSATASATATRTTIPAGWSSSSTCPTSWRARATTRTTDRSSIPTLLPPMTLGKVFERGAAEPWSD